MNRSVVCAIRGGWRRALAEHRVDRLLLLFLGLLVLLPGIGLRDAWPPDEPRFALIARDMVETGNWLIPRVGGELYPDKPPLFMWLAGVIYWLTGNLRVSFVAPSLLAGLGTLMVVHDLARRLWGRRVALYAGGLLLLTVQFALQSRLAQLDALVTFWITLGLYGLMRHLLLGPAWSWYYGAWFAMGLGVITKGVGFLPILLILPWLLLSVTGSPRPATAPLRDHRWWLGPALTLLAIGLWLVPMLVHVGLNGSPEAIAYRDDILWHQTVDRYADSWTHLQPPWYYLVEVIPWAWLPLSLMLPWLIPGWWRRLRHGDAALWLLLGWVICVIAFFSLSPGKRGVYMLPTVPAVVLAAAPLVPELLRRRAVDRLLLVTVAAIAVAVTAVLYVFLIADPARGAAFTVRHDVAPWGLLAAVAGSAALMAVIGWHSRGSIALGLFLVSFWQLLGWWGYPLLNPVRSGSELMAMAQARIPDDHQFGLFQWEEQFLLHVDRPVYHFGFRRDAGSELADALGWLSDSPDRHLLLPEKALADCFDADAADPLVFRHRRQWVLVTREAITGNCPTNAPPKHVRRYDPAPSRK